MFKVCNCQFFIKFFQEGSYSFVVVFNKLLIQQGVFFEEFVEFIYSDFFDNLFRFVFLVCLFFINFDFFVDDRLVDVIFIYCNWFYGSYLYSYVVAIIVDVIVCFVYVYKNSSFVVYVDVWVNYSCFQFFVGIKFNFFIDFINQFGNVIVQRKAIYVNFEQVFQCIREMLQCQFGSFVGEVDEFVVFSYEVSFIVQFNDNIFGFIIRNQGNNNVFVGIMVCMFGRYFLIFFMKYFDGFFEIVFSFFKCFFVVYYICVGYFVQFFDIGSRNVCIYYILYCNGVVIKFRNCGSLVFCSCFFF